MTKTVTCQSTSCPSRRRHHDEPYEPRGPQTFEAPIDAKGPFFCSIECQAYGKSELKDEHEGRSEGTSSIPD